MKDIRFSDSYNELGKEFYSNDQPQPVLNPSLFIFNQPLARALELNNTLLSSKDNVAYLSGNKIIEDSKPLAMAYSGHQFGHFSPQLGDGRAVLLGSIMDSTNTEYDVQLKGSGRTEFSRGGDGRSALGPVLREYLVSEAMAKLAVPTTRALAAVSSGEKVMRDGMIPGGIITRVSRGFVRVGTFQYFSSRNELESVKKLADYVINKNFSSIKNRKQKYQLFLREVIERQATLISKWMGLGFIHGVMNTDNMSICGETIDYGPCAFMDDFDFNKKFSFIDKNGRYAYSNQPHIALWNLTRFAESILSLLSAEQKDAIKIAEDELNQFPELYEGYWLNEMHKKLGINFTNEPVKHNKEKNEVKKLADDLFNIMANAKADFTQTFYYLSLLKNEESDLDNQFLQLFTKDLDKNNSAIKNWLVSWREKIKATGINESTRIESMLQTNPVIIPRNHQIEAAIRAAEDANDFEPFHKLNRVLQTPYLYEESKDDFMLAPLQNEVVERTFCGT